MLSGLLPSETVNALTPDEVRDRIEALANERDARKHNELAQIDLVLGQLTAHLQDIWYDRHGPDSETPRKRGDTNAPTMTEFVKAYAGRSASWCQRCLSAYEHVMSD